MVRMGGAIWRAPSADNILTFDGDSAGEGHDTDGCWDTSAFKFTAPADGLYYFGCSIYTAQHDSSNGFQLRKNGSEINTTDDGNNFFIYDELGSEDHVSHGSQILNLVATDYIQFAATTQSDYYTGHCSAWGCRIR